MPKKRGGPGRAVDQLLEEVESEREARELLRLEGFRGRGAIVTGASTGIGRAIALALAGSGVHIAFNFLAESEEDVAAAERTTRDLEALGVTVLRRAVDCGNARRVRDFVQEAVEELGGLHILVNNAGVWRDRAIWKMSDEDWGDVIRTNLTGTFHFLREVGALFRSQEYGKVVNIASVHAQRTKFGTANYSASKAGIVALTRSAALELGPWNVNVNAVAPGYIRTTQLAQAVPSEILDEAREQSALGRLGDPQDVSGTVLFLCSEAARHITGAVLPVDGGYLL